MVIPQLFLLEQELLSKRCAQKSAMRLTKGHNVLISFALNSESWHSSGGVIDSFINACSERNDSNRLPGSREHRSNLAKGEQ
jgi:hypothetical protein